MILGVHHVGLKVERPAQVDWLDHVGARESAHWHRAPNVLVRLDALEPGAVSVQSARPVNLPGIAHICLQSRDIEVGLERGVSAGLRPFSESVDLGTPFRYLYAHTPEGVLLELEGAPFVRDLGVDFWVGHVAFVAIDLEALVGFYGHLLGLAPTPSTRLRANPLFDKVTGCENVDLSAQWIPGLNLGLEFWQYHHPQAPVRVTPLSSGFTDLWFESDDFEADCAHAIAQNGCQLQKAASLPLLCQSASFTDPEGNCFGILAFNEPHHPMSIAKLEHRNILARIAAQRP